MGSFAKYFDERSIIQDHEVVICHISYASNFISAISKFSFECKGKFISLATLDVQRYIDILSLFESMDNITYDGYYTHSNGSTSCVGDCDIIPDYVLEVIWNLASSIRKSLGCNDIIAYDLAFFTNAKEFIILCNDLERIK